MTDTATMRSPKPLPQNDRDKAESVDETLHLETSERAQEDAMEWKDVFSIRVCLCLLFLASSYMSAIGYILFASYLSPSFLREFGSSSLSSWPAIAHLTCATVAFSFSGRWSDLIGRRWIFVGANLIGAVGTIVCATANSMVMVVAGSTVTGLATGSLQLAAAAMPELVPNEWKPFVTGIFGISGLPIQFAPLIAGSFISSYPIGWRGCYWLLFALNSFAGIGLFAVYFPPKGALDGDAVTEPKSASYEFKYFDWTGLALFAASMVLILVGLQWGGSTYPWVSGRVLGTLISGIVGLIGFGLWEVFAQPRLPLVSPELMRQVRVFVVPCVVIATSAMGYYSLNIIWPLVISSMFTSNPKTESYYQMAIPVGTLLGGFLYSFIAKKIGHYKWQIFVMLMVQTGFTAAMAATTADTKAMSTAFLVISGFSLAFLQLNASLALTTQLPPRLLGEAFGLSGSFRLFVGSVASTIYVTIINNKLGEYLPNDVGRAALENGLPQSSLVPLLQAIMSGNTDALADVPGITNTILNAAMDAARGAYAKSFRVVFLASIAFSIWSTVGALCLRSFGHANTGNHVHMKK